MIRTPVRRTGDLVYGGPLRIKVGKVVAYAAFGSEALARFACEHWSMRGHVHIEPWTEAVRHDDPDSRAEHFVLFRHRNDFLAYLRSPESYPVSKDLVGLHPSVLR